MTPIAVLRGLYRRTFFDGDHQSGLVLADGLGERGYVALSERLTQTITVSASGQPRNRRKDWRWIRDEVRRALNRIHSGRPPPLTTEQRRTQLYKRYRRRLPAAKAFEHAQREARLRRIGTIEWPPTRDGEGGGVVVQTEDGRYHVHWIEQRMDGKFFIYEVPLDREPLPNWMSGRFLNELAESFGIRPTLFRRMWNSPDPRIRARAMEVAARSAMGGWQNFDEYPRVMSRREVELRYRVRIR